VPAIGNRSAATERTRRMIIALRKHWAEPAQIDTPGAAG
jgi:hypothetical protein